MVSPGEVESGGEQSLALDPQLAASARPADASDHASPNGAGDPVDSAPVNPFADHDAQNRIEFDAAKQTCPGRVMMGIAIASYRDHGGVDRFFVQPGDDVQITFPRAGVPGIAPDKQSESVTIVDFYESKMSEYDSTFVFVPIAHLQESLGIIDPKTKIGNVSTIQIKLKPGVDPDMVRDILRDNFRPELYGVYTWRDKQGALLAAVQMERTVLNILLFFIIAVAGFGILAIFFMIVVEKTRDVGILKSLGASSCGILGIFLNRKNIIVILMSIELILLAVNINLVAFSTFLGDIVGQVFALLVLTVAAAEAAIGLAVLVVYFRNRGSIAVEDVNLMKG
jgi:ABC-type lipoprotein release transport system permease subunit